MGFLNDYFRRSNQNIFIQMFFFSKNLRIKVQEINIKLKYFYETIQSQILSFNILHHSVIILTYEFKFIIGTNTIIRKV